MWTYTTLSCFITALEQVKFTIFQDFGKMEIYYKYCTFPQTGTFSSYPHIQSNISATSRNTCVQLETLWDLHQELFCFVSCGPFSTTLKKHIQLMVCTTTDKHYFLKRDKTEQEYEG